MSGYLTTHVLDTANGCPGEGISLSLYKIEAGSAQLIVEAVTNDDGRVDSPILAGISARLASSFSRNGISEAATETSCFGLTSISVICSRGAMK